MEKIKTRCNVINAKIISNNNKIKELENNPIIKEYFKLVNENNELATELKKTQKEYEDKLFELEIERMKNCSHQYIIGNETNDTYRYTSFYCIKCKLYTFFEDNMNNSESLTPIQQQMGNIFHETRQNAKFMHCACHPALADKIYTGIISQNPDISDKELIKYFKAALHNIETKDEEKHIKHLGLRKNYKDYIL